MNAPFYMAHFHPPIRRHDKYWFIVFVIADKVQNKQFAIDPRTSECLRVEFSSDAMGVKPFTRDTLK